MVQLAEISWKAAKELFENKNTVLVPVGSTEQHGPHNPLGTDHLLAAAFSKAVGDKTGLPVLPVIPVGVSEHHRQFTGSLWIDPPVFRDYMLNLVLAASSHGANKIVFINGHGGNTASLLEVCESLRRLHDIFGCIISSYPPSKIKNDGHAGVGETSQNLYFHPHLVKMENAVDTMQNKNLGPFKMIGLNKIRLALFPWDTIDLTETGVLGSAGTLVKSKNASVEYGKELMEPYIEEVSEFVMMLEEANIETLLCKPNT
jgi:creatinine amidohydrolase